MKRIVSPDRKTFNGIGEHSMRRGGTVAKNSEVTLDNKRIVRIRDKEEYLSVLQLWPKSIAQSGFAMHCILEREYFHFKQNCLKRKALLAL